MAWFAGLPAKAQDKCYLRLERLRAMGHELRRPEAVSHGLVKEPSVPPKEIDRAIERKKKFAANPERHTQEEV